MSMKQAVLAIAVGALSIAPAIAADAPVTTANARSEPRVLTGDDALTCDQIYAQGMAESQKMQQERERRNAQMKGQNMATAGLVTGAVLSGGLGGTGIAAQAAAEASADRAIAELGRPQPTNPRLDHLKQLFAQKHCGESPAGSTPGDEALTCEQIAAELAPYAQQIVPSLEAYGASAQQLYAQSKALGQQRRVEDAMLLPLAQAGAIDPTGASKRAYEAAVIAQAARRHAENEALVNSPLARQNKAQGEQMAAQAQQLQSNARIQRLMQLGQDKRCDRK